MAALVNYTCKSFVKMTPESLGVMLEFNISNVSY